MKKIVSKNNQKACFLHIFHMFFLHIFLMVFYTSYQKIIKIHRKTQKNDLKISKNIQTKTELKFRNRVYGKDTKHKKRNAALSP